MTTIVRETKGGGSEKKGGKEGGGTDEVEGALLYLATAAPIPSALSCPVASR